MHMQMLYSPLRVLTVEEADVVYAPLSPTSSAAAMLACLRTACHLPHIEPVSDCCIPVPRRALQPALG